MAPRTTPSTGVVILALLTLWSAGSAWASHNVTTSVVPNACNGTSLATATAVVAGGSGHFSYQWSTVPAQTTVTATQLAAGTYLVVVTDLVNGDQVPAFAIVTDPPPLSVSLMGVQAQCSGQCSGGASTNVAGGTPGYSYLWNTGATTTSVTGLCAGQVSVTVTDANGCGSLQSTTITEPPAIIATHATQIASAPPFCDGIIELYASGGTPPFGDVSWTYQNTPVGTLPDNCIATPNCISELANVCAGSYRATFTDSRACPVAHDVMLDARPDAMFANGFE